MGGMDTELRVGGGGSAAEIGGASAPGKFAGSGGSDGGAS